MSVSINPISISKTLDNENNNFNLKLNNKINVITSSSDYLIKAQSRLEPLLTTIAQHDLFLHVKSIEQLQRFTEYHVFAVWDFMCLLKCLQSRLTCVTIPWFPPVDGLGSHLINAIMVEEEGDIMIDGRYLSHFEIYLEAMEQLGANTSNIYKFLNLLKNGSSINDAINADYIPEPSRKFMAATFSILNLKLHQVTAAFVFGRENITYKMFQPIVDNLSLLQSTCVAKFRYYLERHIELDQQSHMGKGLKLLENLCQDDEVKWDEAIDTAIYALQARYELLDGIYQGIRQKY